MAIFQIAKLCEIDNQKPYNVDFVLALTNKQKTNWPFHQRMPEKKRGDSKKEISCMRV